MEKFKILNRELAYQGAILDFYRNDVQIPNGNVARWDCIAHRGAAAVVAVKDNGKIILVRQYRGAIDDLLLEIPAGARDSAEEDMLVCAMRELEEETGFRTEEMKHLIDFHSAAAYTSEVIGIFYTEKLIASAQKLDENEYVELVEYTLEEIISQIEQGKITDGKTIAAIFAYKNIKEKNQIS